MTGISADCQFRRDGFYSKNRRNKDRPTKTHHLKEAPNKGVFCGKCQTPPDGGPASPQPNAYRI